MTSCPDCDRTLKVVHVVSALEIGGLEMVVADLVRDRHRTVSVTVICLDALGPLAPTIVLRGAAVEVLPAGGRVAKIVALVRRLRRLRPDVVHTHNPAPHLIGAIAARVAGIPVVVHTKHGRNYPDRPARVWLNRQLSRLSDAIVAVSDDAADVARTIERVDRRKVVTIRNGVKPSALSKAVSMPDPRRVISVARLHPIKDHGTLLNALRIVADAVPDVHLDVVGDGAERARLEHLATELQLSSTVTFHGTRHDIAAMLARAGLFVLSSQSEGISLTVLEAMAAGLPVVATNVGGNREIVTPETGWLVPPGDPHQLAAAMLRVIGDRTLAARLGAAGRARVERDFNATEVARCYDALYRRHVRAARQRAARSDSGAAVVQAEESKCNV